MIDQNWSVGVRETNAVDSAGGVDGGLDADAGVVELVPAPRAVTGNLGADLAIMLIEAGRQDAKVADAMRESEERMQEAAEDALISAMGDKSDAAFAAGLAGGFSTAASGVVSLAGGGYAKSDREGVANVVEGSGKLVSAAWTHAANDADTKATHEGHLASRHGRGASDAREQEKAADAFIDRVTDLYKEYVRTQHATQQAAILRA